MSKYTLDTLMHNIDDSELLDIYTELTSGKVPSTSYAHEFCRKVNRMVDAGELSVYADGFRHIYLPSLSKAVYKEMARRFAEYLHNYKAPVFESTMDGAADDEVHKCAWCGEEYDASELLATDLGMLCETCIAAIHSRGEDVTIFA